MTDDQPTDAANHARLTTDGGTDDMAELPFDTGIMDSAATNENVPREDLIDALVILDDSLSEAHATYEDAYDYVTVDGVRGYAVTTETWDRLRDEHDIDYRLAEAAQRAHADQTRKLFAAATDDRATERANADIDAGVVIEMNG